MAIIYNYTKATSLTDNDMLIGTDDASGLPTKNFSLLDIKTYVLEGVDGVITVAGAQGPPGPPGPAGEPGKDGEDGKTVIGPAGLTWKGAWTSGSSYAKNDAVGYDGSSWFCIEAISNSLIDPSQDTTHWALLAAQGADGTDGLNGAKGDPGDPGADGNGIVNTVGGFYTPGTTGTLITDSNLITPESWYRVKLNFTDTTSWLSGNIRGARGAAGDTPETGNFVTDVNAGAGLNLIDDISVPSPTLYIADSNSIKTATDSGTKILQVDPTGVDHNLLYNYVADQHIDWTVDQSQSNKKINKNNIPDLDYVTSTGTPNTIQIVVMPQANYPPAGGADDSKMYVLI